MYHSKLLCAGLLVFIVSPVCAQVINLPAGSPIPQNLPPGAMVTIGGVVLQAGSLQMQVVPNAAQEAARAGAASGGTPTYFQYQAPPLDGLNVNVQDGGVALPADVRSTTLIQSGSSFMIGSPPPVVGGGASARPMTNNSGDKDTGRSENEKVRGEDTASPGKPPASGPTASVPPSSRPTGDGGSKDPASLTPPEPNAPKDPTPPPQMGKPGDPGAPDPSTPPVVSPVPPSGGPKPPVRTVEPSPTAKPRTVVATPIDVRTRDPVAERIDQGMERDIGTTPPIMHRIDSLGVSTPECLGASREGLACQ